MKRVDWNTGRHYTSAGQRITAIQLDDGLVVFVDKDRMIDGIVRGTKREMSDYEIQDHVMTAYDNNLYDYPRDDIEFAAVKQAWRKG